MAVSDHAEGVIYMDKTQARAELMAVTQQAMAIYAKDHPNWLENFSAIRDSRMAWINQYVMQHTTAELRKAVK
jgi:hypothetical protein